MPEFLLPAYYAERCTGCGVCLTACPHGVLALRDGRAAFVLPENCTYCGRCELVCPADAVELYYEIIDVSDDQQTEERDAPG